MLHPKISDLFSRSIDGLFPPFSFSVGFANWQQARSGVGADCFYEQICLAIKALLTMSTTQVAILIRT
jgi:hypothetical protein